jgi:hypothetical protein
VQAYITPDIRDFPAIKELGYYPYLWNTEEHPRAWAGIIAKDMQERGLSGVACSKEHQPWAQLVLDVIRTNYRLNVNQAFIMSNLWHNLKYAGRVPIENQFKDKPALIVSSGPSLEQDIHLIPKLKGKCLMIASGSAVIRLDKEGVTPDVTCLVDPFPKASANFPQRDFLLLAAYTADRVGVANHSNRAFANIKRDRGFGIETPGPTFETDLTVASLAYQAALYWGCNPIVFVGQDCGWSGDKSHADGTLFDSSPNKRNFEMMADYFRISFQRTDRRIINCSHGADLGCEHIDLKDVDVWQDTEVRWNDYEPYRVDTKRIKAHIQTAKARYRLYTKADYESFLKRQMAEPWWAYIGQTMQAHFYECSVNPECWPMAFATYGKMIELLEKLVNEYEEVTHGANSIK